MQVKYNNIKKIQINQLQEIKCLVTLHKYVFTEQKSGRKQISFKYVRQKLYSVYESN